MESLQIIPYETDSNIICMCCGVKEPNEELFYPCSCNLPQHRSCFSKNGIKTNKCLVCKSSFQFPILMLHNLLCNDIKICRYLVLAGMVIVILLSLVVFYFLNPQNSAEQFYIVLLICSVSSYLIDNGCGYERDILGVFSPNPSNIENFVLSLQSSASLVQNWALQTSRYYASSY